MTAILLLLIPMIFIATSIYSRRKRGAFTGQSKFMLIAGVIMTALLAGVVIWVRYFVHISD
jgi:hypothetical protein